MNLKFFSLCLIASVIIGSNAINWNGDWALDCNFPQGNDIEGVKTSGDQCSNKCQKRNGCTHFIFIGDTCYMKKGNICKSNAYYNQGAVCGVVGNHCSDSNSGSNSGSGSGSNDQILNVKDKKLVWSDEFNDGQYVDGSKWHHFTGANYNNEISRNTNGENVWVANGELVMEARRNGGEYTASKLKSKPLFQYGIFESRIKVATARGGWNAFWMLPPYDANWPKCGEIDILEHVGTQLGWFQVNPISERYNQKTNGQDQRMQGQYMPGFEDSFHKVSVDWTPNTLNFYLDDKLFHSYPNEYKGEWSWPFDKPFQIILNYIVGGDMSNQGGGPVEGDFWDPNKRRMFVDYVRVYDNGHTKITWG